MAKLFVSSQNPQNTELRSSVNNIIQASGAIAPSTPAQYLIAKAGVAAMTLAAPVVGTDDGKEIEVYSQTANAHTVTATGLFQTGAATVNLATFAAFAGAGFRVRAFQGKWMLVYQNAITFT
jgi:hypothetical protein